MRDKRLTFKTVLFMVLGALICATATRYFYDPAGLVTGGVSGLSIVLRKISEDHLSFTIPLWLGNILLNIPIFIFAIIAFGAKRIMRTAFVWAVYALFLFALPPAAPIKDNLLLTALFGGILWGISIGMLFNARATTGGTDLLAQTIHHYARSVSMGRLVQVIDGAVVLVGLLVFGFERTLYAVISVFVMGYVIDLVMNSGKQAKLATIISSKSDDIAKDIMENMNRGVTALNGKGMYTGDNEDVLMCTCSSRDIVTLKDIVKKHDEGAFFLVSNVSEAMGQGFYEEWY